MIILGLRRLSSYTRSASCRSKVSQVIPCSAGPAHLATSSSSVTQTSCFPLLTLTPTTSREVTWRGRSSTSPFPHPRLPSSLSASVALDTEVVLLLPPDTELGGSVLGAPRWCSRRSRTSGSRRSRSRGISRSRASPPAHVPARACVRQSVTVTGVGESEATVGSGPSPQGEWRVAGEGGDLLPALLLLLLLLLPT